MMTDDEFFATRLKASICPGLETKWPPAETSHGIALHKCGNEMRDRVGKAVMAIEAVNQDKSLSDAGKRSKKAKIAAQAQDELATGASLTKARETATAQLEKWASKLAAHIKAPEDHSQAVMAAQIRQRVSDMKEGRMEFLRTQAAADPSICGALLSGPAFLSNLSEVEQRLLLHEVEQKYLPPEIVEAKAKVSDALIDIDRSLRAGKAMIRNSAGVEKPTAAELAMARPQQVA